MLLRPDALPAQLARGLKPLYTITGDEPLLAQEAGELGGQGVGAQEHGAGGVSS